jgi:hypothetical protein
MVIILLRAWRADQPILSLPAQWCWAGRDPAQYGRGVRVEHLALLAGLARSAAMTALNRAVQAGGFVRG